MKRHIATAVGAVALALTIGSARAEDNIRIHASIDPMLKLGTVSFEGGQDMEMSVGIGSAAFRHPSLPANVIQTTGDRGPNFECGEGPKVVGLGPDKLCAGMAKGARVYPKPDYAPSIYTIEIQADGRFRLLDVLTVKTRSGRPITGITNPLTHAGTEIPFDSRGRKLAQDPNALDIEGLVRLDDGSYWVGDENAPSIAHIAADGRIVKRLVPKGTEGDFAGADYAVEGKLPALLAKRHTNRGIESMAVSPDEKFLYFALQSPLDNPDAKAYAASRNVRLFKFDRAAERVVGQYVLVLDKPETFRNDKSKKQSDVKVSELMGIGLDKIIVLERINKTTKLQEIDLAGATNILGTKWDDPATVPTLEQTTDLAKAGITPVAKTTKFDSDDWKGFPDKIEGVAKLGDGSIVMINDDDFGIEGARTRVIVVKQLKRAAPPAAKTAAPKQQAAKR